MQSLKLMTTSMSDWYSQEQDIIPTPGEAIAIYFVDTERTELKIGDGVRTLRELPFIIAEGPGDGIMYKTCANCEHLCIINRNKVYAVCDELGKVFELWKMDTRATDACYKFIQKKQGE